MLIKDMKPGNENVPFQAIISYVTIGKTNGTNKNNYLNLVFQDSTGTIDAKLWAARDEQIAAFTLGTVVSGKGDIIKYNNARQMKVISLEKVNMTQNEKVQYLPKAPIPLDDLIGDIEKYIKRIQSIKLYTITQEIYSDLKSDYIVYPAASFNHHEYVSGLIHHTVTMLKMADALCLIYPTLNRDLLFAGTILHDVGKIKELSGPITPSYTVEGNLLGHISIGYAMVADKSKELGITGEEITLLEHMILAHHGKNEFGSPVLPQIKEAEVLSLIDNIDARINMFDKALDTIEEGSFSKRIFALENRSIYKPRNED